ncbi:unnamed protein product, partial [Durusdinium trenchii]
MRASIAALVTLFSLTFAAHDGGVSFLGDVEFQRVQEGEINDTSQCREDWDCPIERPMCDRGRLHCKDLWDFNASQGSCMCEGCSIEEMVKDPERNNVSDCVYECKTRPECKGFQASYTDEQTSVPKTFRCKLLRITDPNSHSFLTGDGQGDQFCFHKVANESQCTRHITCLSTQPDHFCCPDRHGVMLWCCHYSNLKLGGLLIAFLLVLLAVSVYCHCRGYGRSEAASPANEYPDGFNVRFPQGASFVLGDEVHAPEPVTRRFIIAFVNSGSGDQRGANEFEETLRQCLGHGEASGAFGDVFEMRNSERLEAGLDLVAQKLREGQDVAILACGG